MTVSNNYTVMFLQTKAAVFEPGEALFYYLQGKAKPCGSSPYFGTLRFLFLGTGSPKVCQLVRW